MKPTRIEPLALYLLRAQKTDELRAELAAQNVKLADLRDQRRIEDERANASERV